MSIINTWDAGGTWDSGLEWDVNNAPSTGDISPYLDLVTSEHNQQPAYIAGLSAVLQPVADILAVMGTVPGLYDLDDAVGSQLDTVGQWVGRTRFLSAPLTDVYFSFDTPGLGFDQGSWFGPFDPTAGLVALDDDSYRTYLRAVIAANHWDGSVPGAYSILNVIFGSSPFTFFIIDNGDMSMDLGIAGQIPDAVTLALFKGGYLDLRPEGVRINEYITPTVSGPLFGFDVENGVISGFDVGGWAAINSPS